MMQLIFFPAIGLWVRPIGTAAAFNQKVVFGFAPFLLKKVSFLGFGN